MKVIEGFLVIPLTNVHYYFSLYEIVQLTLVNILLLLQFLELSERAKDRDIHNREEESKDKYCRKHSIELLEGHDSNNERKKHNTIPFIENNGEEREPIVQTVPSKQARYYSLNVIDRTAILVLPSVFIVISAVYWMSYLSR